MNKYMNTKKAYFAGGCFWGVEYFFQQLDGVTTKVGYMGGDTKHPTYEQVCKDNTHHAEVLEVTYDTDKQTFEELAKLFFEIHDPTQLNKQGPDIGEQYRSAIFYIDNEQKEISQKLINILKDKDLDVVTQLEKASTFYPAEEYHQKYYKKNGKEPYCHIRVKRFL